MSNIYSLSIINFYRINQLGFLPDTMTTDKGDVIFIHLLEGHTRLRRMMMEATHPQRITLNTLISEYPALSYFDPINNMFVAYWHNKLTQQKILSVYMQEKGYKHYHHLSTYPFDNVPHGKYVAKPIDGSQSHGIVTGITVDETSKSLSMFMSTVTDLPGEKPENVQKVKDLIEKFGYQLLPVPEDQYEKSLNAVADNILFIQEANPFANIEEYRVVKALDNFIICKRNNSREEEWIDYQPIVSITDEESFPGEIKAEIKDFLNSFPFLTYGSFDLWVDTNTQHWGIYEFQTQYGRRLVPVEAHKQLIDYLITSCVDGRLKSYIEDMNKSWDLYWNINSKIK